MRKRLSLIAVGLVALFSLGAEDGCSTETKNAAKDSGGDSADDGPAKVGDTITLEGTDVTMDVKVERVTDPVAGGPYDTPLKAGSHYVGVFIELKNVGDETYSDSPTNGAALILANDEQADVAFLTGGPCSGGITGTATIAPKAKRRGCIPFEIKGKAETFQFTLDSGFGPESGEWSLR